MCAKAYLRDSASPCRLCAVSRASTRAGGIPSCTCPDDDVVNVSRMRSKAPTAAAERRATILWRCSIVVVDTPYRLGSEEERVSGDRGESRRSARERGAARKQSVERLAAMLGGRSRPGSSESPTSKSDVGRISVCLDDALTDCRTS